MRTLKVLHSVSEWLPLTETWLYSQVRFLAPRVESQVICRSVRNVASFPFQDVHCIRKHPLWGPPLVQTAWRRFERLALGSKIVPVRADHAEILHSHFGDIGWWDLPLASRLRLRHVVTFYGYDVNLLPRVSSKWRSRLESVFRRADRVLCEGPHMAACVARLGCPEEKLRVHRLGVVLEDLPFQTRSWDPQEPLKVLIAASFHEKKGIPLAIRALARLKREVPIELTVIGDAHSSRQAEKAQVTEAIADTGPWPGLRLLGYQPHETLIAEAMNHHIYLAPSVTATNGDTEGGAPVTLIELMATGMQVVSSRHCDIPNVIGDRQTGVLADEGSVDGLVECLDWLLRHRERWGGMAVAARKRVAEEFNAEIQGRRLAELYREVAA